MSLPIQYRSFDPHEKEEYPNFEGGSLSSFYEKEIIKGKIGKNITQLLDVDAESRIR